MKPWKILCSWEVVLSTNQEICLCVNILKIQFNSFKVEWIPYELVHFWVLLTSLVRTLLQIKKDASEIILSVDPESELHWWKTYAVGQCKFKTYSRLCMFVWDFFETQKFWGMKIKSLSLNHKKKPKSCFKNDDLCWILSFNMPTFLRNC